MADTITNNDYAIEVNDVTMIFNMASEQLNNLKEYFIKLLRHELFFNRIPRPQAHLVQRQTRRGGRPCGHQWLWQVDYAQNHRRRARTQ